MRFFPCYNDAQTISSMAILAARTARRLNDDFEIIVINDGSKDRSAEVLAELHHLLAPRFKVITHQNNRGYGGALRSGFAAATKEWIFYTDGDAQYDVTELEKLVARAEKRVDVVQGYKIKRHDPLHRVIIGKIYQVAMRLLFGLCIRDVDCDFRLIRRRVFDKVKLVNDSGIVCLELVKKIQDQGFRFSEVGVNHFFRTHGKSQFFNPGRLAKVALGIFGLWLELVVRKTHFREAS